MADTTQCLFQQKVFKVLIKSLLSSYCVHILYALTYTLLSVVFAVNQFSDYYFLININFGFYRKTNCINDKTCRNRNCKKLKNICIYQLFSFYTCIFKKIYITYCLLTLLNEVRKIEFV